MKELIRQRARELGFDECRFTTAAPPDSAPQFQRWIAQGHHGEMGYLQRNAEKRVDPQRVVPGAKTVIVLAVNYSAQPPLSDDRRPKYSTTGRIASYACYTDYHSIMGERLQALTDLIDATAPAGTRSLWYVDTGPVLERDLAQRAGVGFIGKHTNLVSRTLGNWIFLSEIITTLELQPDSSETNRCGTCSRCISACPTAAITAPFQLDARRCISYLTIELKGPIPVELRPLVGDRIYGCDDCLAVCPWNRFAKAGRMMEKHARHELPTPGLVDLLSLDDARFKRVFAGTPMLRTKRRGLLRNVCVALGNVGDHSALGALERAAHDPEPLIAEHAAWAIKQIKPRRSGKPQR